MSFCLESYDDTSLLLSEILQVIKTYFVASSDYSYFLVALSCNLWDVDVFITRLLKYLPIHITRRINLLRRCRSTSTTTATYFALTSKTNVLYKARAIEANFRDYVLFIELRSRQLNLLGSVTCAQCFIIFKHITLNII